MEWEAETAEEYRQKAEVQAESLKRFQGLRENAALIDGIRQHEIKQALVQEAWGRSSRPTTSDGAHQPLGATTYVDAIPPEPSVGPDLWCGYCNKFGHLPAYCPRKAEGLPEADCDDEVTQPTIEEVLKHIEGDENESSMS